ncbi:MAG: hypothetical protein ACI9JM_000477 [Halioglobus sp.]|jgi:hypothetical protein
MNNTPDNEEGALAGRFKQMRQADSAMVPAFPTQQQFEAQQPVEATTAFSGASWKMAVAASVVAVTAVVMNQPVAEDPAALYADIMNANTMTTDSLLRVSDGTLPEMVNLQNAFDIGTSLMGTLQPN